jgi:hypothetical protein
VFENKMLRRIFGPRRYKIIGDWRRLHNEGLHNFYSPADIIRMVKSRTIRLDRAYSKHEAEEKCI